MDRIFAKPIHAGRPIRVYGEMVVRLWHAGLPDAALQLEELWNLLAERYKFSLLCAYPMSLFEAQDTQWFLHACAMHFHLSIVADSGGCCQRVLPNYQPKSYQALQFIPQPFVLKSSLANRDGTKVLL